MNILPREKIGALYRSSLDKKRSKLRRKNTREEDREDKVSMQQTSVI